MCGTRVRKMLVVMVEYKGKEMKVLADIVTGSLYNIETGECYTGNLKIKGWR